MHYCVLVRYSPDSVKKIRREKTCKIAPNLLQAHWVRVYLKILRSVSEWTRLCCKQKKKKKLSPNLRGLKSQVYLYSCGG